MFAESSHSTPLAFWNPVRGVWETTEQPLCGHSAAFSATWPTSGMTRDGVAYALPTSEPPMDDTESSSLHGLLGTPRTSSANGVGNYTRSTRQARGRLEAQIDQLLPTPGAYDSDRGGPQDPEKRKSGGHSVTLQDVTATLLPTPTARDGIRGAGWEDQTGRPLSETIHRLLPTPTASTYGSNQGGSMGRVGPVRESLETMARKEHPPTGALLPTPVATDANGARNATSGRSNPDSKHHSGQTLLDIFWIGGPMDPPFDDGGDG